jgi:hypothetical protein
MTLPHKATLDPVSSLSQKTKIPTFFKALTPLITKFRERWGLIILEE